MLVCESSWQGGMKMLPLQTTLQRPAKALQPYAGYAGAFLAGGILAAGVLPGGTAPLGLALTVGINRGMAPAAGLGALLGSLVFLEPFTGLRLAGAVGAAVLARGLGKGWVPGAAAGCGALLLIECMLGFGSSAVPADWLWALGTALSAGALGWAFWRWPLTGRERDPLWLAALAAGAQGLHIGWLQPGLVLLGAVTLASAGSGRVRRTAVLGIAMAAGCALASPALAPAVLGMVCGALAGAVLAPGERMGQLAAFIGGSLLGILAQQSLALGLQAGASALTAVLVWSAIPLRWLEKAAADEPAQTPQRSADQHGAARRLEQAAEALADIADTVDKVCRKLPPEQESFERVVEYTCQELCAGCTGRMNCWVDHYGDTMKGMLALRETLESTGRLEVEQLPLRFCACLHPAELCATLTRGQALRQTRREERVRCAALRGALTEQYSAMAGALGAMAEQLRCMGTEDTARSRRLENLMQSLGFEPIECRVAVDEKGWMRASALVARVSPGAEEQRLLAGEVSRLCRRPMELPRIENCRAGTMLTFPEKAVFTARFGTAGRAAGEVSGDVAEQFCDAFGNARVLLCDGMGTGRAAAVDGAMAARLTGQLLRAGFGSGAAARLVNVALSLKSQEESSAALDLLSVDLFSGQAELFKAGAAASFLVQNGQVRLLESTSLPIGVAETVNSRTERFQMQAGDIAVLVSDGVLCDGSEWLCQQLELCAKTGNDPKEIADILISCAARRQSTAHPDDITVAVLKLERT